VVLLLLLLTRLCADSDVLGAGCLCTWASVWFVATSFLCSSIIIGEGVREEGCCQSIKEVGLLIVDWLLYQSNDSCSMGGYVLRRTGVLILSMFIEFGLGWDP
jgi:hypothetical protein